MRSYLVSDQDKVNAPKSLALKQTNLAKNASFAVQVSPLDCTGCEVCVNSCLARDKALVMQPLFDAQQTQETNYRFLHNIQQVPTDFAKNTIRGIQFSKPYFEFSGACAGCGESPYIKLVTQLFGNSMLIANATGCSSIYGGSAPSNPYTIDDKGYGPSWANSLFEDNAEFGFGMEAGSKYQRDVAFKNLEVLLASANETIKPIIQKLLSVKDTYESKKVTEELIAVLKSQPQSKEIANVLASADHLPKKSTWIIGGDGWGYDIGYGGLDHVIANKENVNILVLDTEVYSNTGGQASKATPAGSIAKFAATGKLTRKKDLGLIAMSYKEVYVAQVSMGANPNQLLKAIIEAESYNGPSLIIAYAPCINHGFNLANAQQEMRKAVETGY
jgi:pyruvate-ferredoxin/flavodoxin oxidoreductase